MVEIDEVKKEAFSRRMMGVLNDAGLALLGSVGHQTGLFDAMDGLPPSTSAEIADIAGLNERYVREWLAGLTVAKVVEYDAERQAYFLPPEHAASLTRAAGVANQAPILQYIAMMGEVEQRVVDAFRSGGGVPYSAYPRFQRLQAEESARVYDALLVDSIVPLVPELRDRLEAGIDVLDVGTGQGRAVNVLAARFPKSRFRGIDMSEEGISVACSEAEERQLGNATFEVADSASFTGDYDLITGFDVIHDLAEPDRTLTAISRALRDDGVFLMGDTASSSKVEANTDHPIGTALYMFSVFYCMTVSLSQGGAGLGTMWGQELALAKLEAVGLGDVEVKSLEGDVMNVYYVARKRPQSRT